MFRSNNSLYNNGKSYTVSNNSNNPLWQTSCLHDPCNFFAAKANKTAAQNTNIYEKKNFSTGIFKNFEQTAVKLETCIRFLKCHSGPSAHCHFQNTFSIAAFLLIKITKGTTLQ